jgi:hypothetical protein
MDLVGRWRGGVSASKIEEPEVNAPQRPYRAYSPAFAGGGIATKA